MNVNMTVRRSKLDDLDYIVGLKRHPQVSRGNFKFTDESLKNLKHILTMVEDGEQPAYEHYCIEFDGAFAGAVSLNRVTEIAEGSREEAFNLYYLGFDLLPEFQGKGIMYEALFELTQQKLTEENCVIMAECDGNNRRCKRLLSRLQYNRIRVGFVDRIRWMLKTKRITWFARYATSNELWPLLNGNDNKPGLEPPPLPATSP